MKTIALLASIALIGTASIHAQTPTPTPTPAPNYIAQISGSAATDPDSLKAAQITSAVAQAASNNYRVVAGTAQALWANPGAAQNLVDKMGEKAAPVFIAYGYMVGPLSVLNPVAYAKLPKVPAGWGWTILPAQADGTWPAGQRSVKITYTAPAS